jgi:gliding motility-associated-like protein
VEQKNILLFKNPTEKMTATYHANGEDIWVIAHEWNNSVFRSYLVTPQGIDSAAVIKTSVGVRHDPNASGIENTAGQMKISPDGKRLAVAVSLLGLQVHDFNNSTGVVSNSTTLYGTNACDEKEFYGVEFSPNSNILYFNLISVCATDDFVYIFQYDIENKSTKEIFKSASFNYPYGDLQLAPDGKIYVVNAFNKWLNVIERPNNVGSACNFMPNAIDLSPGTNKLGLPSFFASYFLFKDPQVEMPNVFTPDGDAYNPRFVPMRYEDVQSGTLTIINRWGEQVFFTDRPKEGWDGGGYATGTYYWSLTYYGKSGKAGTQRGWVQLVR